MASLSLRHIYKIYQGGVKAVSDFNLEIDDKEFIVFVGPSGCGKSTTLRMVAGLEEISSGELYIDGKQVNDVEPKDRDIAMVFQNYALYPHMTVYDNMAFGLRLRKMNSKDIDSRVQEAAAILGITPLLARKPKALSGGQRQRVALGRAIVREPKVFLLDEPLSNLDAKLRVQMRTEITKLHNKLATTFIYVTHDQTEAMTMGTRIVVMKDGIVQQIDTPTCLYDNPDNLFVASFLGSPQMNFFNAVLVKENGRLYANFGANKIMIPEARAKRLIDESFIGKDIVMGIRPEDIHDEEVFIANNPDTIIDAEIDVIEKLGNETILYMKVDGKEDYTVARIDARFTATPGEVVKLAVDANHIHFFDTDTELTIMGVPRANRITSKLLATEDGLLVRFGNTAIPVSADMASKMADLSGINQDVVLEIAPEDLMTLPDQSAYDELLASAIAVLENDLRKSIDAEAPDTVEISAADRSRIATEAAFQAKDKIAEMSQSIREGAIEIKGTVDFVETYPRYVAAYVKVAGKNGFIVAKYNLGADVSHGDEITMYLQPEKIQLRNDETNEKVFAFKPVSHNSAVAMVIVKDNAATLEFGKTKLQMATNNVIREARTTQINIDPRAISVGKEAVSKSPKMVIVGKVKDADVLGASTIVYADVEGIENFCAIVPGTVNYNINDKVKFVIDPMGISEGSKPSIAEVIAEAVASAPAYKFVEEKSVKAAPSAPVVTEMAATVVAAPVAEPVKKPTPAKKPTTAKKPAPKK